MESKILKIELGGGENPRGEGFLNVDAIPLQTVDIIADIRDLPFENESVDEVFSSAVLKHFNYNEVKEILKECFRVLKIGGKIEIIVPDLEEIIKKYQSKNIDFLKFNIWIYGAQSYSYDYHKSCWDFENFKKILTEIGFSKIEKVPYSLKRDYIGCPMLQIIAYKEKKCEYIKKIKNPVYNRDISYYKKISGEKNGIAERIVPHIEARINYFFHLKRYYFAQSYVKNKKVLDIGCGTGYGDFLLSQYAKEVIGIDISKDAIDFAQEHYKKENLNFYIMDWEEIEKFNETFDVIIAFEFIEHIKEPDKFLNLIKKILNENGLIIISTPNKSTSSGKNPYHYKEYNPYEFEELLSQHFKNFYIYGEFIRDKSKLDLEKWNRDLERCMRYINYLSLLLSPIRFLRRKFILKEKNIKRENERKLLEYPLTLHEIIITSSQFDIWKSDYLIGIVYG